MKNPSILAVLLPLAGCITFGAKPPPSLMVLESESQIAVGTTRGETASMPVTVAVPSVPQSLATPRVPVRATPTSIAYVENAQWSEPPAQLFARLLADTLTARTGRVVFAGVQSISEPGAQLGGALRQFGLDAQTREAVVTYDASLMRNGAQTGEQRRFEARVPISEIDAATAATALNRAANQVAVEVSDWVNR